MKVLANAIRFVAGASLLGALVALIVFPTTSILAMYGLAGIVCAWLGLMRAADSIEAKQPQRRLRRDGRARLRADGLRNPHIERDILDRWERAGVLSYPTAFDGLPDAVKGPLLIAREAYATSDAPDAIVDYEARVAAILDPKPPAVEELRERTRQAFVRSYGCSCDGCETLVTYGGGERRFCGGRCQTIIDANSGEVIFPGETVTDRTLDLPDAGE